MKKKLFLGFDVTPRKALWAEIKRLGKQIEIQERHLTDARAEIEQVRDLNFRFNAQLRSTESALNNAHKDITRKDEEISKLRGRLARYDCPKDKSGRYTKKK